MGSSLPIIPGPLSFLAGAGQAAGAIGQALTERDRYNQALELEKQSRAQQNFQLLRALLAPEAFAQGGSAAPVVAAAGIPAIAPKDIEVPAEVQRGRRFGKELAQTPVGSTESKLSVGVATPGQAAADEAAQAEAETTIRGLAQITDVDQLLQYKKILSPAAAKALEKLQLEKMSTELQQQDPLRIEAKMQGEIRKSVLRRLPKDPQFSKIADYAAVGGLGYLLQELETSARFSLQGRAENTEKLRLVIASTNQASAAYKQARQQWEAGLNQARRDALGFGSSELSQEERTKKLNEVDSDYTQRNPMPTYDFFLDQAIDASGLNKDDYQGAFRSLIHKPGGAAAPKDANFQEVLNRHRKTPFTDAEIDAATSLTPEQKAQLKSMRKK